MGPKASSSRRKHKVDKIYICLFDLRPYDRQVAPALRQYVRDYDPRGVVALLKAVRELLPELKQDASRPLLNQEDYEHWIVSIEPDAGNKPSEQTVRDLCGLLVQPLCVPRSTGFNPMQEMGPLAPWLSERSEWFADLMDGGEELAGGRLEFSFGSGSLVATRQQISQFLAEVRGVSAPEPAESDIWKDYQNLRKLLEAASSNENCTLLKTALSSSG
jgi:hypothetical protein